MKIDLEQAQSEIDDLIILLDLKTEECEEWKARAYILERMLAQKEADVNYEVAGVL